MRSKIYPSPRNQIDAGYFWLSLGLGISLLLSWWRPNGQVKLMWAMTIFGLFHVVQGRKNLKREIELDEIRFEKYLSGEIEIDEYFSDKDE